MRKIRARRTRPTRKTPVIFFVLILLLSLVGLVLLVSRKAPVTQLPSDASGGNAYVCRAPNGAELGMGEALQIAKNSQCAKSGTLTSVPYCNSNSGTWWIDLDLWTDNLFCNPACVVSADGKRAEINYRCTGSIPADDRRCERTGCNGEICQDASLPSRRTSCGEFPEKDCYKKYASCRVQSDGHCGFTTSNQFTSCLSQATCRWCGNECKPTTQTNCNDAIPPASKVCTLLDNRCQAIEASCTWCGERCERGLPSKQCVKGSAVPAGLTCNPVGTGGQCSIDGLPVLPTNAPGYCDDSCQSNSDCVGWLGCFDVGGGIKRCRKANCVSEHTCFCKNTPTPTQRPRPLVTTIIRRVTATPTKTPTPTVTPTGTLTLTPTVNPSSTPTVLVSPIPTIASGTDIVVQTSGNVVQSGNTVFMMSGTAPVYAQLRILINPDGIASTVLADENGKWSLFIPAALSEGQKQVSITATDANGMEIPYATTISVTGGKSQLLPAQLAPYAMVFIGAGAAAVIVFFLIILRRMR